MFSVFVLLHRVTFFFRVEKRVDRKKALKKTTTIGRREENDVLFHVLCVWFFPLSSMYIQVRARVRVRVWEHQGKRQREKEKKRVSE